MPFAWPFYDPGKRCPFCQTYLKIEVYLISLFDFLYGDSNFPIDLLEVDCNECEASFGFFCEGIVRIADVALKGTSSRLEVSPKLRHQDVRLLWDGKGSSSDGRYDTKIKCSSCGRDVYVWIDLKELLSSLTETSPKSESDSVCSEQRARSQIEVRCACGATFVITLEAIIQVTQEECEGPLLRWNCPSCGEENTNRPFDHNESEGNFKTECEYCDVYVRIRYSDWNEMVEAETISPEEYDSRA